jgi:hypothetical protein
VKEAVRKTAIGKAISHQQEKNRFKSEQMIKANMKEKEDGDESWESVEEDAPAIKLEDLLSNMKLDGGNEEEEEDDEESKEE